VFDLATPKSLIDQGGRRTLLLLVLQGDPPGSGRRAGGAGKFRD
jgi:hypothetical protein